MCRCYFRSEFILPSDHVAGVLHASFGQRDPVIEAHLCSELEGADARTRDRKLRIANIIIRIDTRPRTDGTSSYANRIAYIGKRALTLSHLQTITLETPGETEETNKLVNRLCVSHEHGILFHRTCEESWQMALEAVKNPTSRAKQRKVVSPMWFSDRFSDGYCGLWCVIVSRPSMIPRSATELIMCLHRLGIDWGSDEYTEFVAQRAELRKKAEELWAQCDEDARKRVETAANARPPIVRDERTIADIPNSRPDSESATALTTATSISQHLPPPNVP